MELSVEIGIPLIKQKPLPAVLYKYYGPERAGLFSSLLVRFSQLSALNDPFEFLINISPGELQREARRVAQRLTSRTNLLWIAVGSGASAVWRHERLRSVSRLGRGLLIGVFVPFAVILFLVLQPFLRRHLRNLMLAMADDFEGVILSKMQADLFVIFSCSEIWSSVPLWAHYSSNHTGFAIGFDPGVAFRTNRPKAKVPFLRPRKVRYLKETPRLKRHTLDVIDFVAAKMDHWSYEKEWRYIGMPDEASQRGVLVDGHELLLFGIESTSIMEIIFGVNCSEATAKVIIDQLGALEITPTLYQVCRNAGYGFERREIMAASELTKSPVRAGLVEGVGPEMFLRAERAFVNFYLEARQHRFLSKMFK